MPLVRPLAFGRSPNRGHSPRKSKNRNGGAEPRLTSGGIAENWQVAATIKDLSSPNSKNPRLRNVKDQVAATMKHPGSRSNDKRL